MYGSFRAVRGWWTASNGDEGVQSDSKAVLGSGLHDYTRTHECALQHYKYGTSYRRDDTVPRAGQGEGDETG